MFGVTVEEDNPTSAANATEITTRKLASVESNYFGAVSSTARRLSKWSHSREPSKIAILLTRSLDSISRLGNQHRHFTTLGLYM